MDLSLSEPILITGATGFIGARLTEILLRNPKAMVRALVRSPLRAGWLLRFSPESLKLICGDVRRYEDVRKAMEGASVIVHLAFGTLGTKKDHDETTIGGTENVLRAARELGVRRVVVISSWVVYDIVGREVLNEEAPPVKKGTIYAQAKLRAERLAMRYWTEHRVPVVVLQPTMVYGPRGLVWTVALLKSLKKADLPLIDDGVHRCNVVYVDDVVQAILRASVAEGIEGQRYLICNDERITWADFFGAYQTMLGYKCLVPVTCKEIARQARWTTRLKQIPTAVQETLAALRDQPELAKSIYELPIIQALEEFTPSLIYFVRSVYSAPPKKAKSAENRAVTLGTCSKRPLQRLSPDLIAACTKDVCVDITRARSELGYAPEFPLKRGMEITGTWAHYIGLTESLV